MDPRKDLAAAYADTPEPKRDRRLAESWRWDSQMERLSLLVESGHPVAGELRMALGYYEQSKAAAKVAGIDTRRPS